MTTPNMHSITYVSIRRGDNGDYLLRVERAATTPIVLDFDTYEGAAAHLSWMRVQPDEPCADQRNHAAVHGPEGLCRLCGGYTSQCGRWCSIHRHP